jgi:hypothetical protein
MDGSRRAAKSCRLQLEPDTLIRHPGPTLEDPQLGVAPGKFFDIREPECAGSLVRAGLREQQFYRSAGQQAHGRGRGKKLYRSFYMS